MKFSNAKQIVGILIAWAVALLVIDEIKAPRPLTEILGKPPTIAGTNTPNPHIALFINHLSYEGCLNDVREALAQLSWLGKVEYSDEKNLPVEGNASGAHVAREGELPKYDNRLDIEVKDVAAVDFVALERALAAAGFAADRLDFSGVRHFRLEAQLPHLGSDLCAKSAQQGLEIAQGLRANGANIKWIDSVEVQKDAKKIVAYARYDSVVDIVDFQTVLTHMGFAPSALTVRADAESTGKSAPQPAQP